MLSLLYKTLVVLFLNLSVLTAFFCPVDGSASKDTEKTPYSAVTDKLNDPAVLSLQAEVKMHPEDPELHYLLAKCFLDLNEQKNAEESFAHAYGIDSNYGNKIGKEYIKTGIGKIGKGGLLNIRLAEDFFNKAIVYDRRLNREVAALLFAKGVEGIKNSEELFSLAIAYDKTIRDNIAQYYHDMSQLYGGSRKLFFLKKANRQGRGKYSVEIGQQLIKLAVEQKSEKKFRRYLKEARKYVDKKEIFNASIRFFEKKYGTPRKIFVGKTWAKIEDRFDPAREDIYYISENSFKAQSDRKVLKISSSAIPEKIAFQYSHAMLVPTQLFLSGENTEVFLWKKTREKLKKRWWDESIIIPADGKVRIGKAKAGDMVNHFSNFSWSLKETSYPEEERFSPERGIAKTEFNGFSGDRDIWLLNPNKLPITVYYKNVRGSAWRYK